jgi:hypothetical protein
MPFHFQAISPTSQERLLKAMDSLELQDNDYHSKCMHYHVWICGKGMPNIKNKNILNDVRLKYMVNPVTAR